MNKNLSRYFGDLTSGLLHYMYELQNAVTSIGVSENNNRYKTTLEQVDIISSSIILYKRMLWSLQLGFGDDTEYTQNFKQTGHIRAQPSYASYNIETHTWGELIYEREPLDLQKCIKICEDMLSFIENFNLKTYNDFIAKKVYPIDSLVANIQHAISLFKKLSTPGEIKQYE